MYFVLVAMQQKQRSDNLVDSKQRRTLDPLITSFGVRRHKPVGVVLLELVDADAKQLEIADAVQRHSYDTHLQYNNSSLSIIAR